MDAGNFQCAFVETRLNLEPSSQANVVNIRVAPAVASSALSSFSRRQASQTVAPPEAETFWATKNLANLSSVYYRKYHESPRGFLWRLLEDNSVLSILAVDVAVVGGQDAPLTLNFIFETKVAKGCVALADPKEVDALVVYVLDEAGCLHCFSLRPDIFRRRASLEPAIGDLCRSYTPTGLSGKLAHRMTAVSAEQILLSLNDGGILRLDKNKRNEHPYFSESMTNAQNWNYGVRSFFSRTNTAKYGKWNLDLSTVIDAQISSLGTSRDYLFTISIDHRLRVWNPQTGIILQTVDMLNADTDSQEKEKRWIIDPNLTNLVRVLDLDDGRGLVMVYSPMAAGEFKIWKILVLEDDSVVLKDTFPTHSLTAIAPSLSDTWTMADFAIGQQDNEAFDVWVLWKNNTTYRVMHHQSMIQDLPKMWNSWELVRGGILPTSANRSGPCDAQDPTEEWLQLLMRPGRFTKATLETALAIYERSIGTEVSQLQKTRNLVESIASVVSSTAALDRGSEGGMDYEQYRTTTDTHWKRFYRLVTELDKQRGDALSLVYDSQSDMVWIVCADYISAVRECNDFERMYLNGTSAHLAENDALTFDLVATAIDFANNFPETVMQTCNSVLRAEIYDEVTKSESDRIQFFYEKAAFWNGISDEDCVPVVEKFGKNFVKVTNDLYSNLFTHILASKAHTPPARFPLSGLGRKLMINMVQDNVDNFWMIFFTQLILLVHMEFEWESEEDALHHRVNVGSIYSQTVEVLRRLSLLRWLTSSELLVPQPNVEIEGSDSYHHVTALEAYLSSELGISTLNREPLGISLTEITAALCAPDSTMAISVPLVQMRLVHDGRPDLALELGAYSDKEPFSVYVQGRTYLALKHFATAAQLLRKAAVGMATEDAQIVRINAALLADTDGNLLGHGIAKYYQHLVALFEKEKAYSYVLDFSHLVISAALGATPENVSLRADMLSRQFNASLVLSRWASAHNALLQLIPLNGPLGHACLSRLVERLSETGHSSTLVSLPFPGLTAVVDDILSAKCRITLDVVSGPPYHQILYAWRIHHDDFRGAASVLLDRINKLQRSGEADKMLGDESVDTAIIRQYLQLINALSCVDPKQAWIFSEELPASLDGRTAVMVGEPKRKVVTLGDVRKMYQAELERISVIQNNEFGFGEGDAMEL